MSATAFGNSAAAWLPQPDVRNVGPALLLLLVAAPAVAQDAGIQRQLMERQQRTDAFNLQLRQQQEALKASPADRLDNLSDQQLRDVKTDALAQPELRPYERQKADMERQPFRGPIIEVPVGPAPKAEPILPPQEGIQLEKAR